MKNMFASFLIKYPLIFLFGLLLHITPRLSSTAIASPYSKTTANCSAFKDGLRVAFLNVGQGAATLLRCPKNGEQLLIDAGTSNALYPGAEQMFQREFLSQLGKSKTLRYAILSHPDFDHLHNFPWLFDLVRTQQLQISAYLDNGADNPNGTTEETLRSQAVELGIPYHNVRQQADSRYPFCESPEVTLELFYPRDNQANILGCPGNLNDCSIVVRVEYQGVRFLLLADTTVQWEALAVQAGSAPLEKKVDVIQVGHHASASASELLLDLIRPMAAVISSGRQGKGTVERYGYPRLWTVRHLRHYIVAPPFKDGAPQNAELPSCILQKTGGCRWERISVPPTVFSTALHDSIVMYAANDALCIENKNDYAIVLQRN